MTSTVLTDVLKAKTTNGSLTISGNGTGNVDMKNLATTDDTPMVLTLKTGETDIAAADVLGQIDFQAPDETTGTDAILVAAGIAAISEGDFSSSNNATKLSFKTAASEAAAEKMFLSSAGNLDVTGDVTGSTLNADGDTAAGDNAAMGYTSAEGLILTGQGSTSDVTIKNDADADVITIATGTTNVDVVGDLTAGTLNADGDTAAGDNAAIGYTSAEGLILTGQGSTSDITVKNDADGTVFTVPTGTDDILFPDSAKAMWGAGSDLQIYHDGSHSYIVDNATGNLKIQGSQVDILGSGETMATFADDGAVTLYYDNTAALATASGGGTLTGTWNVTTALTPDASDGAALGTTALEFSDLFLADGALIYFGDDQEITLTHVDDTGLNLKHAASGDDKYPTLTLQTGDTDIASADKLGVINFQAPDEGTGTDAILVAAGIEAVSEGDFSSSNNATKLSFKTASTDTAAETMSLSSGGNLTVTGTITGSHGVSIAIGKALAVAMLF